jgi:hypothetical protein
MTTKTEERNDGLHQRHPGRGKCAVIELESAEGEPEVGGLLIFLPSGSTKIVSWRTASPITPTLDAAKDYCARIVDSILKSNGGRPEHPDIANVNWTSVCAAVQRVILDFNDKLSTAARAKMVRDAIEGRTINVPAAGGPILH